MSSLEDSWTPTKGREDPEAQATSLRPWRELSWTGCCTAPPDPDGRSARLPLCTVTRVTRSQG